MKKNSKTLVIFIIIIIGLTGCGNKPIVNFRQITRNIEQYGKSEFQIILNENFINPYDAREIALNMILESPSGISLTLPCYFDNGDSLMSYWMARFTPRETGRYSYYFELAQKGESKKRSKTDAFEVLPSNGDGFLQINDLWTLRFDSGKLFRGIGENIGWESRSFEDSKWNYDYLLPTLSDNGANFFRTWMAPYNFPLEWKTVVNTSRYSDTDQYFNRGGVQRMDEVLELIDSLGLYMMIAFDSHNTLMEGNQWEIHNYNSINGGPASSPEEFFTLKESREKYKNRLRYIVARWGYSPHIASWEFFNEIDNAAFAQTPEGEMMISHEAITSWHKEMGAYLKSIDPYGHIVTTSVSHREIKGLFGLDEIDLNQMHIYRRTRQIPDEILRYTGEYKKPFIWGEFGREWDWTLDFNAIADEMDHDYKTGLWYGIFSPTPIMPMSWWWEFFDERGMTSYFNSVAEINEIMLEAGNGSFEQIKVNAEFAETYAVKCGETYFVYVLNDTGMSVKTSVELSLNNSGFTEYNIRGFLPDKRNYLDLGEAINLNQEIVISDVSLDNSKDIILIIRPVI